MDQFRPPLNLEPPIQQALQACETLSDLLYAKLPVFWQQQPQLCTANWCGKTLPQARGEQNQARREHTERMQLLPMEPRERYETNLSTLTASVRPWNSRPFSSCGQAGRDVRIDLSVVPV